MTAPHDTCWFLNGGFPPSTFQAITSGELQKMIEDELWFGWGFTLRVVPWDGQP